MAKFKKAAAALAVLASLVAGVAALSATSAKAYYPYGYGYGGYGLGRYYYPGYGSLFYNPVSQWIVLSGLFSPYGFY